MGSVSEFHWSPVLWYYSASTYAHFPDTILVDRSLGVGAGRSPSYNLKLLRTYFGIERIFVIILPFRLSPLSFGFPRNFFPFFFVETNDVVAIEKKS